jgi:DNA-binding response OmpR family regulator
MECSMSAATRKQTVVIADDDSDIRHLVTISAARAGLEVVADVPDGEQALEAIRRLVPDLAILDVAMPGRTGVEICRMVRSDAALAGVRLLLLSAAADEKSIEAGLAAGAIDYLPKPFSPRELAARLVVYSDQARGQSAEQSADEPAGQTSDETSDQVTDQSTDQTGDQKSDESTDQATDETAGQAAGQTVGQAKEAL